MQGCAARVTRRGGDDLSGGPGWAEGAASVGGFAGDGDVGENQPGGAWEGQERCFRRHAAGAARSGAVTDRNGTVALGLIVIVRGGSRMVFMVPTGNMLTGNMLAGRVGHAIAAGSMRARRQPW